MNTIPKPESPPYGDCEIGPFKPGFFSKSFPTATFYTRVARTVLKASWMARKGVYDDFEWYRSSMMVHKAFEKAGTQVSIKGTEHLAKLDSPCVIIGNHMSTAETFLLPAIITPFRRVTFVVKQGLVEYPIFKHVMRSRDPIVVGRVNAREDLKAVLDGGKERLANNISLVIFPQRTRSPIFDPASFNTIGVKLAKRAGVPVIPLALKTDAWTNGKRLKDYGRFYPDRPVHLEFGAPLPVENNDREVHEAVIDFIQVRLKQWNSA
ncbi:1-acyl-sn-glycerol-3-phosphate acyltransferase [Puniceicoccales bacterium CK1056]|uniref:1-acyl-sn-glycerol-3-phosphate acyltransferase n=1 Tax=Oceanipulchritudo coccoides TaxID=2706888 RepID=A0A6B2M018_9BACT|nr:lysophospholipid acyltransferase family protein [Oceanipulchritudo coccoides]NDV61367.1 1-acyl-sn-glycerol-3-phosphate acyltransferase [Oceanipulchritudo coccoides]